MNDDGLGAGDDMFTRYAAEEQAERGTVPGSESKGLNIPQAVDPMIDLTSQVIQHLPFCLVVSTHGVSLIIVLLTLLLSWYSFASCHLLM